jgi:hypothetical protein
MRSSLYKSLKGSDLEKDGIFPDGCDMFTEIMGFMDAEKFPRREFFFDCFQAPQ